jgi:threonine/homoserine/homoserine lactone efflux protein
LIVSSAVAFSVVKYAGAAYLVYLGIRRLLDRDSPARVVVGKQPLARLFWRGAVVNVLNPKTALFFFAFLPQFVDVARGDVAFQILVLGLVFIGLAILSDGAYAIAAGSAAGWLSARRGFSRAERYVSGTVLVGLGLATALSGAHRKT